ncbi:NADH-quinone oxidoreductase subunit L [Rhodoblastus acidophilus]|uniref:NADH-quinone oxidoreductase subunit L n=1 Tax=Rhodoblastus acidophilus TaxID=1074 RepID=A0A6N8DRA5_RHOAC|nr:NADH-quinone oxidoreductase subunit L [Rhodoblastus acidophilus]MCW2275398.1 NADH-quinone oxidoreductase subunit L [Rhodoblastus acidophilus]MTV31711.1 NADH-quinone oxidoreductase subunit L [Rhodoblastus acidophilus]
MYSAIVFLPLLGFLIAGLGGKKLGDRPAEIITTALLFVSCALSWITFVDVGLHDGHFSAPVLANWMTSGELKVDWALRVDTLTSVMLIVVTTVSALVHLYSIGYMHEDPSRPRFFAYLSLFTFAMLMLVTADNLAQMFFGWEGVGLASYLLIGFWYEKPSANAAAIKAFVVNRVGDFGFSLGIFLVFMLTGSIAFDTIFAAAPGLANKSVHAFGLDWNAMTLTCLLLFMGAMGKSAQFLLHTWLPDAMEGPTPVSALIHAATMVTAGVFMVARLSPLFEQSATALTVVTLVGGITAFFAATVGLVQNDIKRVIAYSTCSQLGYMFVGLGCGGYALGIFHLFTHAFFKALLFLGAGSVIHALHHEQDMRRMGGLWSKIPVTFACMTIGTLALTGFPMTAGYFSKDAIIEGAFAAGGHSSAAMLAFVLLVLAAGMTSFYSWRLVFMTFFGERRWSEQYRLLHGHHDDHGHDDHHHHVGEPHESPLTMMVPLFVLSIGALAAGYVFKGEFIGHAAGEFWRSSLFAGEHNHILHDIHEVPEWVGMAPFAMMVGGFGVALFMYVIAPKVPASLAGRFPKLYQFLLNKWYFDELYDKIFVKPAFWLGRLFWKGGDGAIIDRFGPDGVAARVIDGAGFASRLQTGFIYNYAFAMLLGLAALITYGMFSLGGGQ